MTAFLFPRVTPPAFDDTISITLQTCALRNFRGKPGFAGSDFSVAAER